MLDYAKNKNCTKIKTDFITLNAIYSKVVFTFCSKPFN